MSATSAPAIIVSGFLGSGKTTLLLRLLQEARKQGLRPGVLMNELGKEDVDGRILGEHADISVENCWTAASAAVKKANWLDVCSCCFKGNPTSC